VADLCQAGKGARGRPTRTDPQTSRKGKPQPGKPSTTTTGQQATQPGRPQATRPRPTERRGTPSKQTREEPKAEGEAKGAATTRPEGHQGGLSHPWKRQGGLPAACSCQGGDSPLRTEYYRSFPVIYPRVSKNTRGQASDEPPWEACCGGIASGQHSPARAVTECQVVVYECSKVRNYPWVSCTSAPVSHIPPLVGGDCTLLRSRI
jgi:hypothetical protein